MRHLLSSLIASCLGNFFVVALFKSCRGTAVPRQVPGRLSAVCRRRRGKLFRKRQSCCLSYAFCFPLMSVRVVVQLVDQKSFERVQVQRLELPESLHPDRGCAHRIRLELAPDHTAPALAADQPGIGQHAKVL